MDGRSVDVMSIVGHIFMAGDTEEWLQLMNLGTTDS